MVTLENLKEFLEQYAKEQNLHKYYHRDNGGRLKKVALYRNSSRSGKSKDGSEKKEINLKEDCHVAIYEAEFDFSGPRNAILVSIDYCSCFGATNNNFWIGNPNCFLIGVTTGVNLNVVKGELKGLLDKAVGLVDYFRGTSW